MSMTLPVRKAADNRRLCFLVPLCVAACSPSAPDPAPPATADALATSPRAETAPAPHAEVAAAAIHTTDGDDAPLIGAVEADDPGDAPHVERALRASIPIDAGRLVGKTFLIDGVPDTITAYWPKTSPTGDVYVLYDDAFNHVVTIEATYAGRAAQPPGAETATPLDAFPVWPASFADGQSRTTPALQRTFSGAQATYTLTLLGSHPWLRSGWQERAPR